MSDPYETNLDSPLRYHAMPILDALPADEAHAREPMLEALLADTSAPDEPLLEAVLFDQSGEEGILEALPVSEPPVHQETNPVVLAFWFLWRIARPFVLTMVWLFGAMVLMGGLAALAVLPVLQFLSLGYLLEAGGRVARSGRFRDGFIGVWRAALLGVVIVGWWLLLWPVRLVSSFAHSAYVIDPGGPVARNWRVGLLVLIAVTALIGVLCSIGLLLLLSLFTASPRDPSGGRRPRVGFYARARDAVWDVTMSLRLPYYFWLGVRGFIGAFVWLVMPVTLFALGQLPHLALLGFVGALWLAIVLLYLPFLQMRLAATNRLAGAFEIDQVRAGFRRAPWAFALAFVVTLLSALPLYLLKIEMLPRDGAWPFSLVFIVFIFPARLLTGWSLSRAQRRATPRHWFFRWTGRLPLLPAAAFYVLVVYLTQFTSWNGIRSLYEQHAFLVPVPFFGM